MNTTWACDLTPGQDIVIPFSLPKVGPHHSVAAGRRGTVLGVAGMDNGNVAVTVQIGKAMRTFQIHPCYALDHA